MHARVVRSALLPGSIDDFMRVWEASITMMIIWEDEATAKASLTGVGMPPIPAEIHTQLYHYRSQKRPKSEFCEVILHA